MKIEVLKIETMKLRHELVTLKLENGETEDFVVEYGTFFRYVSTGFKVDHALRENFLMPTKHIKPLKCIRHIKRLNLGNKSPSNPGPTLLQP